MKKLLCSMFASLCCVAVIGMTTTSPLLAQTLVPGQWQNLSGLTQADGVITDASTSPGPGGIVNLTIECCYTPTDICWELIFPNPAVDISELWVYDNLTPPNPCNDYDYYYFTSL